MDSTIIQKLFHTYIIHIKVIVTASVLGVLIPLQGYGQPTLGAREISLGQATTALPNSEWAVFANPAMMDEHHRSVSFFGIRYYGLSELTDMAVSVTYPTKAGTFAGGAHRFGGDLYNESRVRIAYKNSFEGFHYGLIVNYNHIQQGGGYGSLGALGVSAGLAAKLIKSLWIGAKATNINQPSYGKYNNISEDPPRNLSIGLSYQLSDIALFTTDVYKDVRFPLSYRAGLEVNVYGELQARGGITTEPLTYALGFGYNTGWWGVNVGVQQHENPVLGTSPGLDFNISW